MIRLPSTHLWAAKLCNSTNRALNTFALHAGILAVESYHAGYIRTALIQNGDVVTPYGVNVTTIVNAISAGRDMLDGTATNDDAGIYDNMTGDYILTPTDSNAVAYSRTPSQVLQVAYLNANGQPGGFFPNGVNGAIQYSASS